MAGVTLQIKIDDEDVKTALAETIRPSVLRNFEKGGRPTPWKPLAKSEVSGRVGVRKKYVKTVALDRNTVLGPYAETMDGHWVSGDFFGGKRTGAGRLRGGRLPWGR